MWTLLILTTLALPLLAGDEREEDVLFLQDGKTEEGWVVYEDPLIIILRNGSKEETFSVYDVKEVDARSRHLDELLTRLDGIVPLDKTGVDPLLELARFADHSRLPGEARQLYLQVLLNDPQNIEASEALGGRKKSSGWSVKRGSKWVKNVELDETPKNWKARWTLETAHYRIQTDLPLSRAIGAAFDMERFYRAFRALFGQELRLVDNDEIMEVLIVHGAKGYAEQGDGRRAFFDESDRTLSVNAQDRGWERHGYQEATGHLIYMTTEWTPEAKGDFPPWATIGIGEAMATGLGGHPGGTTFDLGSVDDELFLLHADDLEAFELRQVLNFTRDDYKASRTGPVRYAVSYTLVHFLLYGENGAYREPFMDFLRSACEGKSSMSHFKDIMPADLDEMNAQWGQYVERLTGP